MPAAWLAVALAFLAVCDALPSAARPFQVRVDPGRASAAARVDERFVSFAVDMDQLVGGRFWDPAGGPSQVDVAPYDFDRPVLRNLTAALAPAWMRLGGSASDRTFYDLSDTPVAIPPAPYAEVLTRAQWDGAMRFARDLGLEVILTLNAGAGPRDTAGAWTDANARELLAYVAAHDDPVGVVEFGNEPNLFAVRAGIAGYTAVDYARDLERFRALRDALLPTARLFAPGTIFTRTQGEDVLPGVVFGPRASELLPLIGATLDGVAYHYYAAISERCPTGPRVTAETALDADYLDGIDEAASAVDALRDQHASGAPVWMTESGGQSCGGQAGVGDRFLNTFWYLNSLGRLALHGQEVFVRQTLSGSTYGLIDETTLAPRPDYWAALLWRRLMGTQGLRFARPPRHGSARVYAHCQRGGQPGSVVVLALNLDRERPMRLRLRTVSARRPAALYLVTAPDASRQRVDLNGVPLAPAADGTPPALVPSTLRRGRVVLPPLSFAFVLLPEARAAACTPS